MVSLPKNQNLSSYYFLDIYLLSTFMVSVFLWFGSYFTSDNFFKDGFFTTVFLVTNYYYFINGVGWSKLSSSNIYWPLLFLLQIFSLIGMSHVNGHLGGIYLGIIPAAFGLYFFSSQNQWHARDSKKGAVLFLLGVSAYVIIYGITKKNLFSIKDGFHFCLFIMWGGSIIFWSQQQVDGAKWSILDIITQNLNNKKDKDFEEWPKERLFFHDLINQTHGVDLYLNQKISSGKDISQSELEILREEIRLIQSLIKDHYGYSHKNLFGVYEYVSFNVARKLIDRVVSNYLPDELVDKTFAYKGEISKEVTAEKCIIHYPSFCRIFTNLVKNINEVKTDQVEFIFDYFDNGLEIFVRNKVCYLKDDQANLTRNLEDIISGKNLELNVNHESGLGLESIASMVKQHGGSFHFSIEGEYWVNRIFLPKEQASSNFSEKDYKKAA